MTNSRQNTLIIAGVLVVAIVAEVGILMVKDLPATTTGALTNLLTGTIGGLIGFLARGPGQPQPGSKTESTDSPPDAGNGQS